MLSLCRIFTHSTHGLVTHLEPEMGFVSVFPTCPISLFTDPYTDFRSARLGIVMDPLQRLPNVVLSVGEVWLEHTTSAFQMPCATHCAIPRTLTLLPNHEGYGRCVQTTEPDNLTANR